MISQVFKGVVFCRLSQRLSKKVEPFRAFFIKILVFYFFQAKYFKQ
jgi:hypothetical protein